MSDLDNCPNCGKLFLRNKYFDVCADCRKEEEKAYLKVTQFMRKKENRSARIAEVVEATGVDEKLIFKFIKNGLIHLTNFPNLGYPCEKCGTLIQKGVVCDGCSENLKSQLETYTAMVEQKKLNEETKRLNEGTLGTYRSKKTIDR